MLHILYSVFLVIAPKEKKKHQTHYFVIIFDPSNKSVKLMIQVLILRPSSQKAGKETDWGFNCLGKVT